MVTSIHNTRKGAKNKNSETTRSPRCKATENSNFQNGKQHVRFGGHYVMSPPYYVIIRVKRMFETKKREKLLFFKRESYLKLFGTLEQFFDFATGL